MMETLKNPLSAVIVLLIVTLSVCSGILSMISPKAEVNGKRHLIPRHHTIKRHINKFSSHILEENPIGLPKMRQGYKLRRERIEKGVMHLKSRNSVLTDFQPSDELTQKYKSLREDGVGKAIPIKRFKTCAIVHSSGIMTNSKLGSVIDSYDTVFRLDADPTFGHEDDVGEKTSVRVVAPDSISELVENGETILLQNETLVFYGAEHIYTLGFTPKMIAKLSSSHPDIAMYRMTNGFEVMANNMFKLHTNVTRRKVEMEFSSAFHAILLMLDICQDIHLYGFIPNNYCLESKLSQMASLKYYQTEGDVTECEFYQVVEEMGNYRPFKERDVIKDLAEEGKLSVKEPLWN